MTDAKRPLKVFLCHASADKPKVRELYRTLKRRGVQPWLDAEDLIPGQNWEVEIPKALLSSDAIIICLTPNSVDKEGYVQKEIKFALDKAMEMPEGRIFIIPARLEDCELPFSLRQYQAVNLYEKTGYTKLMQALKLRASQLERATVELPKKGETTAEIKKVVEEKKSPEPKEEKPEIKTPKPSQDKVGVGGDVKDSVIVSGSGNVINIGEQKKTEPEKPQPRKTKPPSKPKTAIVVALIGLAGTIIAALLGSPLIEQWFSLALSATELTTITATLTSRPSIPSQTVEPSLMLPQAFTSTPSVVSAFQANIPDGMSGSLVFTLSGGLYPSYRDVYSLDLKTGITKLIFQNGSKVFDVNNDLFGFNSADGMVLYELSQNEFQTFSTPDESWILDYSSLNKRAIINWAGLQVAVLEEDKLINPINVNSNIDSIHCPQWHPTTVGRVLYTRISPEGPSSGNEAYMIETIPGAIPIRLGWGIGWNSCASWSPDGKSIAFGNSNEYSSWGEQGIFVVDYVSGGQKMITNTPGTNPIWSPNGEFIAFLSDDGISVVSIDGSNEQLVLNQSSDSLIWMP